MLHLVKRNRNQNLETRSLKMKTRPDKARQDKAGQAKTRQDKTRQDFAESRISIAVGHAARAPRGGGSLHAFRLAGFKGPGGLSTSTWKK